MNAILDTLRSVATVRMARPGESFSPDGVGRNASAWTTWSSPTSRPTVVLTESADLHTCAHELAHILLGHGSHVCANLSQVDRAKLEIDAETGAVALLSSVGATVDRDRASRYILGWLSAAPSARPSVSARTLTLTRKVA